MKLLNLHKVCGFMAANSFGELPIMLTGIIQMIYKLVLMFLVYVLWCHTHALGIFKCYCFCPLRSARITLPARSASQPLRDRAWDSIFLLTHHEPSNPCRLFCLVDTWLATLQPSPKFSLWPKRAVCMATIPQFLTSPKSNSEVLLHTCALPPWMVRNNKERQHVVWIALDGREESTLAL